MSKAEQNATRAFLGAGGQNPRVDVIDTESLEMKMSIPFPPSHSIYAIDADWHTNRFTVGTKGGVIHIYDDFSEKDLEDLQPSRTLTQGAPILSVSHVDKSRLAVSDIAGRCLLWQQEGDEIPIALETRGEVVCSLLMLSGNRLSGLSSEGTFLNWDLSKGKLLYARHVAQPPPIGGIVRTVFWPAAQAIVFPDLKGNLVLYDLERDVVRDQKAHEGLFYALCLFGESLLTIGMEDRCLRLWASDCDEPTKELSLPGGIHSVSNLGGARGTFLLVNTKGTAQAYLLDKDELVFDKRLPGEDYRVSFSPPCQVLDAQNKTRKDREARELWASLENGRWSDQENLEMGLSRLKELGYSHVVSAIQAEEIEKEGNMAECLRLRSVLARMLPEHPAACLSLEKYAASLARVWLLPEAENICKRILSIDPNYRFTLDFGRISTNSRLLRTSLCTIEPDVPIRAIIDAANALGQRFSGCYLLRKLPGLHCRHTILSSEAIAEKYLGVQAKSNQSNLPPAKSVKVWWMSKTGTQELDFVIFGKAPINDIEALRYALHVLPHSQGTLIIPTILLDWSNNRQTCAVEEANRDALAAFLCLTNGASSPYLKELHRTVNLILRRLISKGIPIKGDRL